MTIGMFMQTRNEIERIFNEEALGIQTFDSLKALESKVNEIFENTKRSMSPQPHTHSTDTSEIQREIQMLINQKISEITQRILGNSTASS